MKVHQVLVFISILSMLLVSMFYRIEHQFSDLIPLQQEVVRLKKELEDSRFAQDLKAQEFLEFQAQVASLIPNLPNSKNYAVRNIASVIDQNQQTENNVLSVQKIFDQAKIDFQAANYEDAVAQFQTIIELYPSSPQVIEANLLLSESLYQQQNYEDSLKSIERMLALYPDNVLTGYAMLRMAVILERFERYEEASEIYKIIQKEFKTDDKIQAQVQRMLQRLG